MADEKNSTGSAHVDKDFNTAYTTKTTAVNGVNEQGFYDPSKESLATRLGINFESFKRAPGATGYVVLLRYIKDVTVFLIIRPGAPLFTQRTHSVRSRACRDRSVERRQQSLAATENEAP